MELTKGLIKGAQKCILYGPEGIGKSTFASQFPNPVFIDTEGSTKLMDVTRTPKPSSWTMLLEQVKYFKNNPHKCNTLVIDTADWAERLCKEEILAKAQKDSLSKFAHGQGYVILTEEFGRLLNLLEDLIERNVNVVITAHATMRKFEQPDEMGAYDRWELKLEKKVFPLLKEWADMVLFANYKTFAVKGQDERKNKAQGGKRVIYTSHHPCWDAKNRHGLKDELLFDFTEIAHCIPGNKNYQPQKPTEPTKKEEPIQQTIMQEPPKTVKEEPPKLEQPPVIDAGIPKALADLMTENKVTFEEIQKAVASRGYYPVNTPIENYDPDFIAGVLVGAWSQVFQIIQAFRDDLPFE